MFHSSVTRRRTCTLLAVVALLALLSAPVHAAPASPPPSCASTDTTCAPYCGTGDQANNCGEAVTNHSGPVQDHPVVYLIFWWQAWNDQTNPNYAEYTAIIT